MIVKITFLDLNEKEFTMMFGNSYKDWLTQFEEYLYRRVQWWNTKEIMSCDIYQIIDVEKSPSKWVGYGGLKWCCETELQGSLDHEAKGLKKAKARQYKEMSFTHDESKFYKTSALLKDRLRHLGLASCLQIKKEAAFANFKRN